MVTGSHHGVPNRHLRHVFSMALALAGGVFFFHTGVLFEVARHLVAANAWLTGNYGPATAGKRKDLIASSPSCAPALTELRLALNQDQPIGNDRFYREIEVMTGQRRELRKRGRPRKQRAGHSESEDGQRELPL